MLCMLAASTVVAAQARTGKREASRENLRHQHALVTPGDQGDKLSADTAEASPAIGQDAPQPAAAADSGFIKKIRK